jgi:outer membrane protein TolC
MSMTRPNKLFVLTIISIALSVSAQTDETKKSRKTTKASKADANSSLTPTLVQSAEPKPPKAAANSNVDKAATLSGVKVDASTGEMKPATTAPVVPAATPAASQTLVVNAEQPITLQEFVTRLRHQNRNIAAKRTDREIATTGVERAGAAFQPQLNVTATNGSQRQKNSFEEYLYRGTDPVYERRGQDVSASVSQLVVTGAKIEAKATLSRFITNINRSISGAASSLYSDDYYNRTQYGLGLSQPLLRDAGSDVTRARVRVAELDDQAAGHTSRETESSVVAEGIMAYYDLAFAQEKFKVAEERVATGQRLLKEARALVASGRLPQSDILEVENSLGRYQSTLSEARQQKIDRSNRLRSLVASSVMDDQRLWRAADDVPAVPSGMTHTSLEQSAGEAKQRRDDLLMRRVMVERESTQVNYARNQALPKLDFVANYYRNGYELSAREAFAAPNMRDFPSWSVGFQLNMPIGADQQARADLQAAMLRRRDAQSAVDALESTIANDIETTQSLRDSAAERLFLMQDVAQREQKLLELERRRLSAGRSDMREILLREERSLNAQLGVVEQRVALAKAQTLLQAAQGILLQRFE